MKRLQLFTFSALFALGASSISAQDGVLTNEATSVTYEEEVIFKPRTDKKPKFEQWQPYYSINKIEYTEDEMVITFDYKGHYSWLTFYGPEGLMAWQLIDDATGDVYHSTAVTNVKMGKNVIAEEVIDNYGSFSDDGQNFTCEVHFPRLPRAVKQVDLIEGGKYYREHSNHFNVYDIQLKTPKVKRKRVRIQEEVIEPKVEEVATVTEENTNENKIAATVEEAPTFNIYPNPTTTLVNVEQFETQAATLEVLDLQGKIIQTLNTQERVTTIDVSDYPAGSYFIKVSTENTQHTLPFIIE